jgi:hypothetical protein
MKIPVQINGKYYVEMPTYAEEHQLSHCGQIVKKYFGRKPISVLEIGVLKGHNAEIIVKNFNVKQLILVDPWDFCDETHPNNWAEVWYRIQGRKNVIVMKVLSEQAAEIVNCTFDWIYIDGEHTGGDLAPPGSEDKGIRQDIALWLSRVNPGGIISGHDYNFENIKHEVNKVFGDKVNCSPEHPGGGQEWWVFV